MMVIVIVESTLQEQRARYV